MAYNKGINEIYEWYNAITIEELYKIEEQSKDDFIKNFTKEMIKLKSNRNINKENQIILNSDYKKETKWLVLTTKKSLVSYCYCLSNEDENENEILINLKSLDRNNLLEIHIANTLNCFSEKPKYIYSDIEILTERITALVN